MRGKAKGFTAQSAEDDGEALADVDEYLPVYHRLVFRKKNYLAGWRELSCGVGSFEHYRDTIKMIATMITDDGDDPADFEFRVDKTEPVRWETEFFIDGAALPKEKGGGK